MFLYDELEKLLIMDGGNNINYKLQIQDLEKQLQVSIFKFFFNYYYLKFISII